MKLIRLCHVALATLATVGTAAAQSTTEPTPEAAALAYAASARNSDWASAARMLHPSALKQLHDLFSVIIAADETAELRQKFLGVASSAEAAALPDTVLVARFFKAAISQQSAGMPEVLRTSTATAIGHVSQGPDTAFVVLLISMKANGIGLSSYQVNPFVRDSTGWRALLTADLSNMVTMLKRVLGERGS